MKPKTTEGKKEKRAIISAEYDWIHFIQTQSGHDLINRIHQKEIIFNDGENKYLIVKPDHITSFFVDKKKQQIEFNKIISKYPKWSWIMSYSFLIFRKKSL